VAAWVNRGALLVVVALIAACVAPAETQQPAETPAAGLSPAIDAARAVVAARLADGGYTLEEPVTGYEPGAPGELQATPKAVFRVNLIDPGQGWVVIYDCAAADLAVERAQAFAAYLRSSGRSNYPGDAQYTLNVLGTALIFHWWSAQRTSEPDRARAAFEIVGSIGQHIDIGN